MNLDDYKNLLARGARMHDPRRAVRLAIVRRVKTGEITKAQAQAERAALLRRPLS